MAIGFRAAGTAYQPTATASSNPIAVPAATAGDWLLAVLAYNNATTTTTPPGAAGYWTVVPGLPISISTTRLYAYYRFYDGTEGATQAFALSTAQLTQGRMYAYSGVDATTPLDVTPVTQNTGASDTSITLPAITPITIGAWVARIANYNAGTGTATITAPGTHNDRGSAAYNVAGGAVQRRPIEVCDKAWSGSGAEAAATATAGVAGLDEAVSIALRPAAAAAPPVHRRVIRKAARVRSYNY